ncbi:hypothetical protein F9802_14705 [Bacillus aerolatus]|uniref:Uncharacterized protein n=1 Tax=Bacillus aerolatus TaxID=2653354 RepID=A0A6I1FCZ0_9BACI|nr:hypothetical protein [Bacillus aerolatus]KAB7705345.1 hypothetical protein F9802_14705 [Bacillus aerolatus]
MAEEKKRPLQRGKMDNPDQMETDKESIYDKFKSEQTVDSIPLEDLRMEQEEEKDKHGTKDDSSSEEKYPG